MFSWVVLVGVVSREKKIFCGTGGPFRVNGADDNWSQSLWNFAQKSYGESYRNSTAKRVSF